MKYRYLWVRLNGAHRLEEVMCASRVVPKALRGVGADVLRFDAVGQVETGMV